MNSPSHALWIKASLGCTALVLALFTGACRRQPSEIKVQPGTDRVYRFSLVTTVVPPGEGKIEKTSIEGVLNVRALVGEGTRALGFELSRLDVQRGGKAAPSVAKALSVPFLVTAAPAGKLGLSRFLPEISRPERASLDSLVRSLEIVLSGQRANQWEATGSDQNGDYLAAYTWGTDPGMLSKRKLRYTSTRESGWVSLNVVESSLTAKLDPALWLHSAQLHEKFELRGPQGQMAASIEVAMQMQPLAERPAPSLALMQKDVQSRLTSPREDPTAPSTSAWDELAQAERREEFIKAGVTLDVLLERIAKPDLPRGTLSLQVSAFVQAFPDQVKALAARLEKLSDADAELVTNALVMAGTAQAEEALIELLGKASNTKDRAKLLQAIATASNPSSRMVDAILTLLDRARAESSWEDATTAARVLSLLGARKSAGQAAISTGLRERLAKTDTPREQQLLLQVLQNADPPLPTPEALAYLKSPTLEVRGAAVELLAASNDPAATAAFESVLADRTDEPLRRAAITAVAKGAPSERLGALAAGLLADNSSVDARTRASLVQCLIRGLPTVPGNRARLEALLKQETSRPLLALILNALAADAKTPRP